MPRLAGRGIEVSRALETDDDRALVDRALVEQVFVNLLLNAADSMTQGGRLTVTVRREELAVGGAEAGGSARICVDVADTGTGIAPDVLPHIFEPFFTTKTDGQGTGLGLAIAARILDAHHGDIQVAPHAGGGSVFTVRIPAPARPAAQPSESVE
jgi:signal transduction histidine kinase